MVLPVFIKNVAQHLSFVWLELTLAVIATISYLVLARWNKKVSKKHSPKLHIQEEWKRKEAPRGANSDSTLQQIAAKALRQGLIVQAVDALSEMPEVREGWVPDGIAQHLLLVAARTPRSSDANAALKTLVGKIMSAPLEAALAEAVSSSDVSACRQLHAMSNVLSIPKSHEAWETLAHAYSSDAFSLRALLEEVEESGLPVPSPFSKAVLETEVAQEDGKILEELLGKVDSGDVDFLRSAYENAAGVARARTAASTSASSGESDGSSHGSPRHHASGDIASLKESVSSALKHEFVQTLNPNSKKLSVKEIAMRANDIRSCGKNGDLRGATKVFWRLGSQAEHPTLANSIVEACVECKDMEQAMEFFTHTKKLGIADASVYNTMMKGYIANGQEDVAKGLLAELSHKGLAATRSSFHGLLNARVNARDLKGAWKLVEDMQAAGLQPNAVTCSILMKGKLNSLADVSRVMALIDAMEQPMDEVLFLSVVEACIRTGRLDQLLKQFDKFMKQTPAASLSAPTFGTMIKAYGNARDVKTVWHLWEQMLAHNAHPTAVTMGCMVEALVANGRALDAWRLTQKMWSEEQTRPLVNTVIYSSILKGFAHNKETDKVLALYEEMKANNIQPNTITFNTILNAFAQGGVMNRVPSLLEDMKSADPPVEPDIVTYSTIVKGFCNSGSLDRALKVLKEMKANGKYAPDEVMYNSLLSGCAKEHRPDEALQLLSEMKKSGVAPSNYTLSMLVKLMGRCKRLNQAFVMLEDISREYGLKINVQVYTCLIQGCFNANQTSKAISLYDKIIKEGLNPDAMTYAVLVRGFIQAGMMERAVEVARAAHGINISSPQCRSAPPGLTSDCLDDLLAALGGPKSELARELKAEIGDFKPAATKGSGKGHAQKKDGAPRGGRPHRAPAHKAEQRAMEAPWRAVKA